jgi:hypothetical protein
MVTVEPNCTLRRGFGGSGITCAVDRRAVQ